MKKHQPEANDRPDQFCLTMPDGSCVSTDPRCMHNVDPTDPSDPPRGRGERAERMILSAPVILFILLAAIAAWAVLTWTAVDAVLSMAGAVPLLRLPTHWEEVTTKRGTTFTVPKFVNIPVNEIVAFRYIAGHDGFDETAVYLRNGETVQIAMQDDELLYLLELVGYTDNITSFDRRVHRQAIDDFRMRIRGQASSGNSGSNQQKVEQAPVDRPEDDPTGDTEAHGWANGHCQLCDSPMETGTKPFWVDGEPVCQECYNGYQASLNGHDTVQDWEEALEQEEEAPADATA